MTASITPLSSTETEILASEYAPQPAKRHRVVTETEKVHMYGVSGFLCGSRSKFWMVTNRPITCRRCRQILAAEGYYE